jgi:hypothetical protein
MTYRMFFYLLANLFLFRTYTQEYKIMQKTQTIHIAKKVGEFIIC